MFLLAGALACADLAWGALRNLWSDYQDSSVVTYIVIGGTSAVLSLACVVAAVRLMRRPR